MRSIRLPHFFLRQRVVPFETVFAFFCIFTGCAALARVGVASTFFARAVGQPLASLFNVALIAAGICMYGGVGLGRRDIEGFGLIIIITSLVVRSIAITLYFGWNPIVIGSYIFNLAFVVACLVRLDAIFHLRILVEAQDVQQNE